MLLCLDAGNSRLKAGLWDGTAWCWDDARAHGALDAPWPEGIERVRRVVACNVAGEAVARDITHWAGRHGWPLAWLQARAEWGGVRNAYADPAQLGADRYAALLAAREAQLGQSPVRACVVVLAGTATTVDALAADGAHRGGFILPGLALMRSSLARSTAQLPEATGAPMRWPDHTDAAIVSGCLIATLGAIALVRARLGEDTRCLLGGGAATELSEFEPALAAEARPRLVLDGLRRYAEVVLGSDPT